MFLDKSGIQEHGTRDGAACPRNGISIRAKQAGQTGARVKARLTSGALSALLVALVGVIHVGGQAVAGTTTVPRPDHIVIVVEENHSATSILGNPNAPYINSLADQNANFTRSYAVTHPSQPNYIALFSGSTQGVTNDSCPHSFTAPSLADQLSAVGRTFVGFSESLPSQGFTGCTSGKYAAKHSPWVNFPSLASSTNQPLTAFPTNFNDLPDVSFVIPNLDNDMHDGTVAQGDTWLQTHLSAYVSWAKTHNSLFVLTFDEDDNNNGNLIPTVMAGERVTPGVYSEAITHYNVLRTVQDAFGLTPLGSSAAAAPVLDVWNAGGSNQSPTARFTSSCTDLSCVFDATTSSDPEGPVASYAWNFGDGTTATGATPAHVYTSSGTYDARVTVADADGATDTTTRQVSVTAPAGQPFAVDRFARTVSNAWGTADVGGAWSLSGASSAFSVSGGSGLIRHAAAGSQVTATLGSVSSSDTDLTFGFNVDKPTAGYYLTVTGRRASAGNEYRARILINSANKVNVLLTKVVGGTQTTLVPDRAVPGLTYTPATLLRVRMQVTGTSPTTVRARLWSATDAEPGAWLTTTTDSTPGLQTTGAIALTSYLSSAATNAPALIRINDLAAVGAVTASPNQSPTARFTSSCTDLSCVFDATPSSDPEGPVASYAWNFGDGATATGATPAHVYTSSGTYAARVTVADADGATNTTTHQVTVTASPNQSPTARFTSSCTDLSCVFDATTSSDPEGPVASYAWNFGDGTTATGATPAHVYTSSGTYAARVTVADADGATNTTTHQVTVTASPNQSPTARFTSSCTDLSCVFDATTSSDPEGPVASYAWNFGDGTTATGATPAHVYTSSGTYDARVTVADADGATDTTTRQVSVTAPAGQPFAVDRFARTVSNAWGTADVGGAWSLSGASSAFSVSGDSGLIRHAAAGSQVTATLGSVSSSDTDLTFGFNVDKPTAGYYLTVTGRRASAGNEYRARILINSANKVNVLLTKVVGGTQTTLVPDRAVPGLTYTPATLLRVRMQVTGTSPTTVRARVWSATDAEPGAWLTTTTDSTPGLQTTGAIALTSYLSSAATNAPALIRINDLTAR